jgi:recombinational DNA repair ATPase RecF
MTSRPWRAELRLTGKQKALLIGLLPSNARLWSEIAGTVPALLLHDITAHEALLGIIREQDS